MKIPIKIKWTCSDFVHHQHRWYWSAWLCGRAQEGWLNFRARYTCEFKLERFWSRLWFRVFGFGAIISWDGINRPVRFIGPRK